LQLYIAIIVNQKMESNSFFLKALDQIKVAIRWGIRRMFLKKTKDLVFVTCAKEN